MAKNIDFMGATFPDVPSIRLPQHEGGLVSFTDVTDTTAVASDVASGKYFYTADGEKTVGTASGGITPSGTYSITSNGIYDIVSFASVDVNVSGGGGGDHDAEDGMVTRMISDAYENSRVTSVGSCAFYNCKSLKTANFPNVTSIGVSAFTSCTRLTTGSFPNVTSIGSSAFENCTSLTTASFPNVISIGNFAFYYCSSLTTISFPNATSIGNGAFASCTRLTTASFPKVASFGASCFRSCQSLEALYVLASSVATLGAKAFLVTPMSSSSYLGHFGSIYVPASLVDSYKSATNWSAYADRITAYEG